MRHLIVALLITACGCTRAANLTGTVRTERALPLAVGFVATVVEPTRPSKTEQRIEGAEVAIYDDEDVLVASARSGADGVFQMVVPTNRRLRVAVSHPSFKGVTQAIDPIAEKAELMVLLAPIQPEHGG